MMLTEKGQKYQHYHLKKSDKYEYLTGKKILSSDKKEVMQQAKSTCSPLGKVLKANKNDWGSRKKTSKGAWKAWKTSNYV